ncbi:MAG: sulfur carrier protein ThiS [Nitriliruptorales bacterium]|nr:sulfur carrier protein ThiS [Nitriliruptorales bacterium]
MRVVVNGGVQELADDTTVGDVVAQVRPVPPEADERAQAGIAVALNGEVVTRRHWWTTRLSPGDRVEVLAPIQGG